MRLTEVAHQTLVRPEIDLLVAEENDEMVEPCPADRRDGGFVELAQIDAVNLGPDRPGNWTDVERVGSRAQSPATLRSAALIRDCQPGPSSWK